MSSYVISCCSTADLTEEHFSKREISYICFHYKLNDTEYADDLGKSMPFDQFYAAMAAGASTKTSQVNADEFEAYFETFLQDGKDILHVCLSSGISGVLNSAMIAKADLEERYPERKILIVDSLGASSGYGLLMDRLADLRDEGKPLEEVYDFAMKNRLKVHHWFFSTDLTFYVRGGRISKASGAIGGLLGICPLLNMDNEGRLIPRFKIRTKKKSSKKSSTRWKKTPRAASPTPANPWRFTTPWKPFPLLVPTTSTYSVPSNKFTSITSPNLYSTSYPENSTSFLFGVVPAFLKCPLSGLVVFFSFLSSKPN